MQLRSLLALALTGFVLVGVCAISVGLLLDPLMSEFHWKNAAASAMATVYSLAAMLSGPVVGILIDRFGSKRLMIAGIAITALGYLGLGFCHALPQFYAAFVLIGVGYGGAFFLASSTLIAKQMGEHKNLAMGIWMGAGSTGAACFSFAVAWSLTAYGWRTTALTAAVLVATMVPVTMAFIPGHKIEAAGAARRDSKRAAIPWGLLIAPAFALLCGAGAFAAFGMSGVYFHAVPILLKAGFTEHAAGIIFGASWILSALGSMVVGAISDRFGTARVLKASLLVGALGTLALGVAPSMHLGVVAAIVFIVLWGATANAVNQFVPILIVERFGPVHLGFLVGVQGAVMGVVGAFAPIVTGALYDRYASYAAAIAVSVLMNILALALVACLRGSPGVAAQAGESLVAGVAPKHIATQ